MENEKKAVIWALAACVIWGTVYVAIKVGLEHGLMPFTFAGVRFLCGGLLLLAFVWRSGGFAGIGARELLSLAGLGLLQTAVQNALFFYGVDKTSAGVSAIFINTSPFFVIAIAPLFFPDSRVTPARVLGCVLGFAGVAAAAYRHSDVSPDFYKGVAALTLSALTWALSNMFAKRMMSTRDALTVTGVQMALGAAPLLLFGIAVEGDPFAAADATAMLSLAYLIVFATSIPFLLWYRALSLGEVGRVSIFGFTLPVFGVVSGWLVLGVPMTPYIAAGMAMVAAGIIIVNQGPGARGKTM